jgi:hypothetical protein
MKTITKLTLAGISAALFTASAIGNDTVQAIDNHHGAVTYLRSTQQEGQRGVTIGVYTGRKAVGFAPAQVERQPVTFHQVSTPHGTVSYFAPAE